MKRKRPADDTAFGSDSFLDIVANVVGILIILVVVVALRAKKVPTEAARPTPPAYDLTEPAAQAAALEREIAGLGEETARLQLALRHQDDRRSALRVKIAAEQTALAEAQRAAGAELARRQQTDRELARARAERQRLAAELDQTGDDTSAITIESYPTPLSRAVEGKEVHFQLRGGRVAWIPLEPLLARLKQEAPGQFWKLKDLPEASATVGPIGGFRLRYTFQRVDIPLEDQLASRRFGSYAQLSEWTLVPVSGQMGETVQEALSEQSEFRATLAALEPDTAVTLWTYPDSFAAFRQLKKALYQRGFATAARPLPEGTPIAGSPRGSKSAAQ